MKRFYLFLLLLISLIFFQCQKEVSYIGAPDILPEVTTPKPISANIQGNILDENDQPAAGVTVTVGARTAITNANGYFRIANASLDEKAALVTAEKAGYFKGLRSFSATSGTNQVVIKLIKKNMAGTINAASGGNASLANGTIISLPANGVVSASGNDYTGSVNIYASYIDPSSGDIGVNVPGSFAGTNKDGKRVILTSYGMVAVELESISGEKLQIKQGSVATLTTPIPLAGLSTAPATIPLWYVDEQTGLWKEEGTATKQGNTYVGEVKHFSFWNCDVSVNAVTISMRVVNSKNLPLVHVPVKITRTGSQRGLSVTTGYTDSLGKVSGFVPSGENLLVEILDPCGNAVHSQNVSPLTQSTDIGSITMPATTTSVLSFKGKLVNCAGSPVINGFAIINFNNMVRYAKTDANGNFENTFIVCPGSTTTSTVIGVDQGTQQQSAASTVTVTIPTTNAGNIITCGVSSIQFINYTLDGTNYALTTATGDSLVAYNFSQGGGGTNNDLNINGSQIAGPNRITFSIKNPTATGTFPVSFLAVQHYGAATLIQPFNVTLTSFANTVGGFYEGSFTGQFRDSVSTVVHNISTTFRVRRNN